MQALLLVAHGSRRESSNEEVRQLAKALGDAEHDFGRVEAAFLELAEPSIPDGIRQALAAGAERVVVVPYFLSAGRHVVTDIPAEVDQVRRESPNADIVIAPYFGSSDEIPRLLLVQARNS